MLRRLLLLLALLVALPATARPACHDAGTPVAHAAMAAAMAETGDHRGTHGDHHQAPAAPHDCLGCIPPDMLLGTPVRGTLLPPTRALPVIATAFVAGEALRPTPPPPKKA